MTAPGYSVTPNRVAQNAALSPPARLLYVILLGWRQEPDGTVLATLPQLAEAIGLSRATVARLVRELGVASVLRWDRGGRGRPNRYELLDVRPRSRRGSAGCRPLPQGAGFIEAGQAAGAELAVAQQESAEPHHDVGVLAAVDVERPPEIRAGAARGAARADLHPGG